MKQNQFYIKLDFKEKGFLEETIVRILKEKEITFGPAEAVLRQRTDGKLYAAYERASSDGHYTIKADFNEVRLPYVPIPEKKCTCELQKPSRETLDCFDGALQLSYEPIAKGTGSAEAETVCFTQPTSSYDASGSVALNYEKRRELIDYVVKNMQPKFLEARVCNEALHLGEELHRVGNIREGKNLDCARGIYGKIEQCRREAIQFSTDYNRRRGRETITFSPVSHELLKYQIEELMYACRNVPAELLEKKKWKK